MFVTSQYLLFVVQERGEVKQINTILYHVYAVTEYLFLE